MVGVLLRTGLVGTALCAAARTGLAGILERARSHEGPKLRNHFGNLEPIKSDDRMNKPGSGPTESLSESMEELDVDNQTGPDSAELPSVSDVPVSIESGSEGDSAYESGSDHGHYTAVRGDAPRRDQANAACLNGPLFNNPGGKQAISQLDKMLPALQSLLWTTAEFADTCVTTNSATGHQTLSLDGIIRNIIQLIKELPASLTQAKELGVSSLQRMPLGESGSSNRRDSYKNTGSNDRRRGNKGRAKNLQRTTPGVRENEHARKKAVSPEKRRPMRQRAMSLPTNLRNESQTYRHTSDVAPKYRHAKENTEGYGTSENVIRSNNPIDPNPPNHVMFHTEPVPQSDVNRVNETVESGVAKELNTMTGGAKSKYLPQGGSRDLPGQIAKIANYNRVPYTLNSSSYIIVSDVREDECVPNYLKGPNRLDTAAALFGWNPTLRDSNFDCAGPMDVKQWDAFPTMTYWKADNTCINPSDSRFLQPSGYLHTSKQDSGHNPADVGTVVIFMGMRSSTPFSRSKMVIETRISHIVYYSSEPEKAGKLFRHRRRVTQLRYNKCQDKDFVIQRWVSGELLKWRKLSSGQSQYQRSSSKTRRSRELPIRFASSKLPRQDYSATTSGISGWNGSGSPRSNVEERITTDTRSLSGLGRSPTSPPSRGRYENFQLA